MDATTNFLSTEWPYVIATIAVALVFAIGIIRDDDLQPSAFIAFCIYVTNPVYGGIFVSVILISFFVVVVRRNIGSIARNNVDHRLANLEVENTKLKQALSVRSEVE